MNHLKHFAFAAALLGSSLALADSNPISDSRRHPDVVSTGRAIESSTDVTLLPASTNGTVTVNGCSGCRGTTVGTNADTVYTIGRQTVTLAQLKSYVADGRPHPLTVVVSEKLGVALRVSVGAIAGRAVPAR